MICAATVIQCGGESIRRVHGHGASDTSTQHLIDSDKTWCCRGAEHERDFPSMEDRDNDAGSVSEPILTFIRSLPRKPLFFSVRVSRPPPPYGP